MMMQNSSNRNIDFVSLFNSCMRLHYYLLNLFLLLWCCSQDPKEGGTEKRGAAETHERGIFSR